jgi:hypothetical protein
VLEDPLARDKVGGAGPRDETPSLVHSKSMVLSLHGRETIWIFEGDMVALGDQRQGGGVGHRQIEAIGRRDHEAAICTGLHAMRTTSQLSSQLDRWCSGTGGDRGAGEAANLLEGPAKEVA